ncbi:hypothetical protein E4T39_00397 [Aureobasidium subglaciale]|nr:hypothetical protein E4T39_00397 [Aureobasidium subglaciale]
MAGNRFPQLVIETQLEILEYFAEDARHEVAELIYDDAWRCYARLLLPAILVNRDWCVRGTDLLWREPFTPALAKIHPQRRQLYADKIQSIGLYLYRADHTNCPASFTTLRFPRLKRLGISSCSSRMELDLTPYLSQSVTSFTMLNCRHLPKSQLDLIAYCCPKLRKVHLDYLPEDQHNEHFIKFLQKCRLLRDLALTSDAGLSLPVDVLENIAARKQLEHFDASRNLISYNSIATILQSNPRLRLFRNIRSLCLDMESRAVAYVLSAADLLVELRLTVTDSQYDVFGPIGSLPCLQTLDVCFSMAKRLAIQELHSISGLIRLKDLSIYRPKSGPVSVDATLLIAEFWTDELFQSWVSSYPDLEKLHFGVRPVDSHWISETRIIAKSCPKLIELLMGGIHDIGAWGVSPEPFFPALQQIDLGQLKPWPFSMSAQETKEFAKRIAHMIDQHTPVLEELSVGYDDLGSAVAAAYVQLKAEKRRLAAGTDVVVSDG